MQTESSTLGQLKPMVGRSVEAGVKAEWLRGVLLGSAAVFDIRQRGRAQLDTSQSNTACDGGPCYVAAGEVRSRGFEAELAGRLTPQLDVSAGYTFNKQTFSRDADQQGQPFSTYAPRHLLKLWGSYLASEKWTLAGGVTAQSSVYATDGSFNYSQPKYAVVDLMTRYRFDQTWSLSLNVNNLNDKRYYQTPGTVEYGNFYGKPREFVMTLRASL